MYEAKVLADSISPDGVRLITTQATFPRFILAEFNTHRVLSRNSASSRAIPTEKLVEQVEQNPFVPEVFFKRVKGMGQGEPFDEKGQELCRVDWNIARREALNAVFRMNHSGVAKSQVNRLLEPFMWHTVICTATSWDNFFNLRAPVGDEVDYDFPAQPEIQKIAIMMRQVMRASKPKRIDYGQWHLPLLTQSEIEEVGEDVYLSKTPDIYWPMISAGRCARVSFDTHENYEEFWKSYQRAEKLEGDGHMSPDEHPARPLEPSEGATFDTGNFEGWVQLRKLIPHEANPMAAIEGRKSWDAV